MKRDAKFKLIETICGKNNVPQEVQEMIEKEYLKESLDIFYELPNGNFMLNCCLRPTYDRYLENIFDFQQLEMKLWRERKDKSEENNFYYVGVSPCTDCNMYYYPPKRKQLEWMKDSMTKKERARFNKMKIDEKCKLYYNLPAE